MATTNYNIRLEQELRDRAFAVFERYGLAPSQAIKLFLNQVADTQSIPLSFNHHAGRAEHIPNALTRQALLEAIENRKNAVPDRGYNNLDDMMKAIQEWQE
jgi:addiction module antitoxin, relB/dinJ family